MPTRRLTDAFAEQVRVQRRTYFWDRQLAGLALRVGPTRAGRAVGARVWVFRYRMTGQSRRPELRLGRYPMTSAATAREAALRMSLQVTQGEDPGRAQPAPMKRRVFTVRDLCEHFERFHLPRLSPKTARPYKNMMRGHVLHPEYGLAEIGVNEVERGDVQRMLDAISEQLNRNGIRKIGQTKKVKGFFAGLLKYGVAEGLRDVGLRSPMKGVRVDTRRREFELEHVRPVGHVFEPEETQEVWKAFDRTDVFRSAVDALKLIALTGMRADEARTLTWDAVDLSEEYPCIRLRRHKTDRKRPVKEVPLSAAAVEMLSARGPGLPKSPVFASPRNASKPIGDIWTPWSKIRELAGVPRARIHDLRGLAACHLVDQGWSEVEIMNYMGWDAPEMVRRYTAASRAKKREGARILELQLTGASAPQVG